MDCGKRQTPPVTPAKPGDYPVYLRCRLAAYRDAEDFYAKSLTKFLGWIDWFFDVAPVEKVTGAPPEKAQRGFFLKEPAYLWTAPAFDRCLLLALFYPVLSISVVWAISGEVGPAERALFFKEADGKQRLFTVVVFLFAVFAYWRSAKTNGWRKLFWIFLSLGALAPAVPHTGAATSSIAVSGALLGSGTLSGAVFFAIAITGAVAGAFAVAVLFCARRLNSRQMAKQISSRFSADCVFRVPHCSEIFASEGCG